VANIVIGAIIIAITALAIYYSINGKGGDCSSCNGHCHSGSCDISKNDDDNTPCESFIRGLYFNLQA